MLKLLKKEYKRPMLLMLLSIGLLLGILFSIQAFKGHMVKKYMMMARPPITVSAMKIQKKSWQPTITASASLRAVQGVDVTTEIAGLVRTMRFTPGSEVKKGDLLVELNADAEREKLTALVANAELAKITFDRDKALLLKQSISQSTLDMAFADLKGKQALVAEQEAIVEKKSIKAPFDGVLGISTINLGQYLNPGDKIVTLQALNPIFADFYVPQSLLSQVQVGQAVELITEPYSKTHLIGTVTTIDPKIDPNTRNGQIEATIPNLEHRLLPGMFSKVVIDTGKPKQQLTLPQTAITYNPYGDIVFIIEEKTKDEKTGKPIQTVKQVFVTLGETRGTQVSIESGIQEGDLIVTSGQAKLKNGSKIIVNNTVTPNFEATTPAASMTNE